MSKVVKDKIIKLSFDLANHIIDNPKFLNNIPNNARIRFDVKGDDITGVKVSKPVDSGININDGKLEMSNKA
ncbi:MAG: hypothetical protein IH948_08615 [Bacteroidetes bacterium]|nr:hypothetical protein [Bacteroidota bacterium]